MTTPTTQFAPSSRLGLYEPMHQMSMWEEDTFDGNISPNVCNINDADDKIDYTSDKSAEDSRPSRAISDKTQRRLAQNREAARKSRQRKKVYVQQLETSRLKLTQLELELERARQQGMLIVGATAHMGLCGSVSSGIAIFEVEYSHWLDQQERKIAELKNVLRTPLGDPELSVMVESVLSHYCSLFRMKRDAARADAFYLVSGMWKTSVERFFLWIGGFKPSELINVVMPQLQLLTEKQTANINILKHSCMQAEDALSQGMEKLQQTLAQSVTLPGPGIGNYCSQTAFALENLESLEGFINQADHLRQQTLKHMASILTTRQAANGLVAFGEYFQRLRTLSSLWSARSPGKPA
ncbi:transcription factor TGA3-like [Salvia splendens]|uniref:transcription factor TGA3-like n=1 Tax=Salvia splendens TaxID=180675 RepID=UPI001C277952|nr:transcription factor TGA3-like [Salvia splendens]XP_042046923.1 transcription factor TGA3-like [Salvia splendens]XP_042046924.1 transcription factor TGA3-like [Salvia splendens]